MTINVNVHHYFHNKDDNAFLEKLNLLLQNQQTMATEFAQLKTAFGVLTAAITTERQQILDKLAAAEAKAASLEADLAQAGTDEERAALHAEMLASIQVVKDIVPDPADVPPAPTV